MRGERDSGEIEGAGAPRLLRSLLDLLELVALPREFNGERREETQQPWRSHCDRCCGSVHPRSNLPLANRFGIGRVQRECVSLLRGFGAGGAMEEARGGAGSRNGWRCRRGGSVSESTMWRGEARLRCGVYLCLRPPHLRARKLRWR